MSVADNTSKKDLRDGVYRVLKTLRGSFLLSLIAVGVVLFATAILVDSGIRFTGQDGVIAAMLGIFGISAAIFGVVGYLALMALHRA